MECELYYATKLPSNTKYLPVVLFTCILSAWKAGEEHSESKDSLCYILRLYVAE